MGYLQETYILPHDNNNKRRVKVTSEKIQEEEQWSLVILIPKCNSGCRDWGERRKEAMIAGKPHWRFKDMNLQIWRALYWQQMYIFIQGTKSVQNTRRKRIVLGNCNSLSRQKWTVLKNINFLRLCQSSCCILKT